MKKEYVFENSDYLLSYVKICGKKIKDIVGYVSNEFGDPTFKICRIIFEDGTTQEVEGEHDFPYIADYNDKTKDILEKINGEE